jgi:hypothetical protein
VQTYRKQITFDQDFAVRTLVRSAHRDIGTLCEGAGLLVRQLLGLPIGS